MDENSKYWDLSSMVNDQQKESSMMITSSPIINDNENGKRQFTWEEISRHSNKNDRWIVIDDRVYDVTKWLKHPGGQMVLKHYAGQDATEAFRAFHPEMSRVQKYLKLFYIGDVSKDEENNTDDDQALKDDFEQLRQKVISKNLSQSSRLFFFISCLHILAFEFAAYFILFQFGTSWVPYLTALVFYTIVETQAAYNLHDLGHLSVFTKSSWNHLFAQLYGGLIAGASASWWNHMHFQHHCKPNIIDKDPDTRLDPLFVIGDKIPISAAHRNAKYGKTLPYDLQYLYSVGNIIKFAFFNVFLNILVGPFSFAVFFQFMMIRYIITRHKWIDLVFLSLFYVKFFSLMSLKLGFVGALKFYFLFRLLHAIWFGMVSQSNHIVMDVSHDDKKSSWLRMHLKATCNLEKSHFNDWFTGHLNFQIEHHLFPLMPRHNLYKIQPDVIDLCRKYNIPYVVKPMGRAYLDIFTSLKNSGRMWREAYEELINTASHIKSNT